MFSVSPPYFFDWFPIDEVILKTKIYAFMDNFFLFSSLLWNPVRRLTLSSLLRQWRIRESKPFCAELKSSQCEFRKGIHLVTTLRLWGVNLGVKLKTRSASTGFVHEFLHTPHKQTALQVHSAEASYWRSKTDFKDTINISRHRRLNLTPLASQVPPTETAKQEWAEVFPDENSFLKNTEVASLELRHVTSLLLSPFWQWSAATMIIVITMKHMGSVVHSVAFSHSVRAILQQRSLFTRLDTWWKMKPCRDQQRHHVLLWNALKKWHPHLNL